MQVTTSGVIHKTQVVLDKNHVNNFLKNQKATYCNFLNFKNVVYNKDTFISDPASNYINIVPDNEAGKL